MLNRTLPQYLVSDDGDRAAVTMQSSSGEIAEALRGLGVAALDDPVRTARVLRTVGESFRNFGVVARREAELRGELARIPEVLVAVPDYAAEITDLTSLARVGRRLLGRAEPDTSVPSAP